MRFLETHPECAICFHNALIIFDDGRETQLHNPDQQKTFSTIEDLWERNFMATCSVMFRAGLTPALPDWSWGMRFGDWPLHLLNAEHGTIGYLPDVMATYRRHAGGVFGGAKPVRQLEEIVGFYEDIAPWVSRHFQRHLRTAQARVADAILQHYLAVPNVHEARRAFAVLRKAKSERRYRTRREMFDLFLLLYLPRLKRLKSSLYRWRRRVTGVCDRQPTTPDTRPAATGNDRL